MPPRPFPEVPADFEEYARRFPAAVDTQLRQLRETIRSVIPQARETISYGLPAFSIDGKAVVWFAAFTKHIGFYPGAAVIAAFQDDLASYRSAKGSVQFPMKDALPLPLIRRMVQFKMRGVKTTEPA